MNYKSEDVKNVPVPAFFTSSSDVRFPTDKEILGRRVDVICPVSCGAPFPHLERISHPQFGPAVEIFYKRNAQRELLKGEVRFLNKEGKKEPRPFIRARIDDGPAEFIGRVSPNKPWSLYGLDALASKPEANVLITEGPKARQGAADRFEDWACVSASGASSADSFDWSPLNGRRVVIWPDNDGAGERHASDVSRKLGLTMGPHIVRVGPDFRERWDLADPLPDGVIEEDLRELLEFAIPTLVGDISEEKKDNVASFAEAKRKKALVKLPQKADWYSRAMCGTRGNVLSNVANALLALRDDQEWNGRLTYNAFTCTELIDGRPITDKDIVDAQEWMQLAGLTSISEQTAYSAVNSVAQEHSFHPVMDYLSSLVWDHIERLDKWVATYLGAENSLYASAIGRMFPISMIARVSNPGCKCDHSIILEGHQGIGKSTACKILAGGDQLFSDSLPLDLSNKDAMDHLPGKWLIDRAELSAFNKSDLSALKAFMTKCDDKFRPAYGRKQIIRQRQCVFAGTTNAKVYLKDETGNRRFWPIACGKIDLDGLARDRDQLLAEAFIAYKQGERWWPDRDFEKKNITPEQEARFCLRVGGQDRPIPGDC